LLQIMPHDPQLLGSVCRLRHVPLQSVVPVAQTQLPPVHVRPVPHAFPHDPQLSESVDVFAHAVPHNLEPEGHAHTPAPQNCPAAHAFAQVPQCATVLPKLFSQPFATVPSQSPHPSWHVLIAQAPPLHEGSAWGRTHTWPQMPQLNTFDDRSTHTVPGPVPQGLCPVGQTHDPPTQDCAAGQWFPQLPQCIGSVMRFTQAAAHIVPVHVVEQVPAAQPCPDGQT